MPSACVKNWPPPGGLPFAKPAAVNKLEILARSGAIARTTRQDHAGSPWVWLALGLGIMGLVWGFVSFARRRTALTHYPGGLGGSYAPTAGVTSGYGVPPQGGGMGSGIVSGLATGAALGAGMAAGEALADSLMHPGQSVATGDASADAGPPDFGGSDFGLSDADGWDGFSDTGASDLGDSDNW